MALSVEPSPNQDPNSHAAYVLRGGAWQTDAIEAAFVLPKDDRSATRHELLGYLLQSADARPLLGELCQTVVTSLTETFYAQSAGPTEALRAALLAANQTLFEHNVRADTASRLLIGIACVVVRGHDVYMGRLGPGCVWIISDQEVEQFPSQSLWYSPVGDGPSATVDQEPPAGMRGDVEPDIGQTTVAQNDVVALLSQAVQRRVPAVELLRAVRQQEPQQTQELLAGLAQGRDLALLAMTVGHADELAFGRDGSLVDAADPTAAESSDDALGDAVEEESSLEAEKGQPREAFEPTIMASSGALRSGRGYKGPDFSETETTASGAAESDVEGDWDEADDDLEWDDFDELDDDDEAFAAIADEPVERHDERPSLGQRAAETAREAGRVVGSGAGRVRDGAEDVLLKVLPDRLPERPESDKVQMPHISPASQSLVIIALLLPLLVLFTVIMVRVQYNNDVQSRRTSIIQTVLSEYDAALNADNVALRADGLYRTLEQVEMGLSILPADETLIDLRKRATLKLDEIEKVERLYHFKRLDSYTVGGTAINEPSRVVVEDKSALVLNKGAGQVLGYMLSDVGDAVSSRAETRVLLRAGEMIGATQVGELVDVAWLAATGSRTTGSFVALDRSGTLWTLRDSAFYPSPVADSDDWGKPVAIGAYMGNLYVLDPFGRGVLKYLPSDNTYTTPPFPYLSSTVAVDMLSAVDMAVDGNIYVLFADGTIHKFFDGEEQPFPMTGLPSPIQNPTSIFVSGTQEPDAAGYVYVTDRGNQRIVQFDKAGNYIRSLKANTSEPYMTALGSVYVDEGSERIFIFNDRQFVLVSLPPVK